MFLTEGTKLNTSSAITASPSTGWQMLYESETAWHKLEMGMTRLEHSAIVREDHGLLQEGVKEFFTKAKKWFQWAGQEFLRYLDKVIDVWTNIQNKIRTMVFDREAVRKNIKNGKSIKLTQGQKAALEVGCQIAQNAEKIKKAVDDLRDAADKADNKADDSGYAAHKLFKNNGRDAAYAALGVSPEQFDKMASGYGSTGELSDSDLQKYANFAKDGRIRCIKCLQYVRNSFAKMINMGIRSADAESEDVKSIKNASSKLRELANKYISIINRATNAVISAFGNMKERGSENFKVPSANPVPKSFFD